MALTNPTKENNDNTGLDSENEPAQSDADLEVRILQQILFSAGSDELPYSRFRRIKTPTKLNRKTFLATYMVCAFTYLLNMKEVLYSYPLTVLAFIALLV